MYYYIKRASGIYNVLHVSGDKVTYIATTDTCEKADFLAKAGNLFTIELFEEKPAVESVYKPIPGFCD